MKPILAIVATILGAAVANAVGGDRVEGIQIKQGDASLRGSSESNPTAHDGSGAAVADEDAGREHPPCGKIGEFCMGCDVAGRRGGGGGGCGCCAPYVCGVVSQACSFPIPEETGAGAEE